MRPRIALPSVAVWYECRQVMQLPFEQFLALIAIGIFGLVHSGRNGTELGVVANAFRQLIDRFGSDPANMIVQLTPCIRPPHYEVDFAAEIVRQCRALGFNKVHDSGVCTACNLPRYYSYRAEKGKTGRLLALLGMT